MLNKDKHEILLKQILRDIYKDQYLQGKLVFKGGTCLYIFYDLNRFSVDLDFNLRTKDFSSEKVTEIVNKYLNIEDHSTKTNTWFWLGSYEKGLKKIKIEISKRDYPEEYIDMNYFGIPISTMKPEYMFAHKLCAITDRRKLQNRDLFDSYFMFNKGWEPNEEIIKIRTERSKAHYFEDLISFIKSNAIRSHILDGLGEVVDENQKTWIRDHLIDELVFQLGVRVG